MTDSVTHEIGSRIQDRSTPRFWVLLLGVAATLRIFVAFVVLGSMPALSDAAAYAEQGKAMAEGSEVLGPFYWPPGTSYALAWAYRWLGASDTITRLITVALGVMVVAFTLLLAREILKSRVAAEAAGWIAALYPANLLMAGQPFSFHLTAAGIVLSIWLLLRGHRQLSVISFALSGASLGVAALARPGSLSLGVALLPLGAVTLWRSWHRDRIATRRLAFCMCAFVVGTAAVVSPAIFHNVALGEGWTISTNNERNLWYGNNPYTPHYLTAELGQRSEEEMEDETRSYIQSFTRRADAREAMRKEALRYISEHPQIFALRSLNRIRAFWGFEYTMSRNIGYFYGDDRLTFLVLPVEAGGYMTVMVLAIAGVVFGRHLLRRTGLLILALMVVAYMIPHVVAFAAGVWHLPVMPLLMIFGAAGIAALQEQSRTLPATLTDRRVLIPILILLVLQVEYGYFVLAYAN